VRRFLNSYTPPGGLAVLSAADVTRALLDEGEGRAPVSVKKFGYALRAFLRFCLLTGVIDHDLTGATLVIRSPQPPTDRRHVARRDRDGRRDFPCPRLETLSTPHHIT